MDRLDKLAREARELLSEIDAVLESLNTDISLDVDEEINAPDNDTAENGL